MKRNFLSIIAIVGVMVVAACGGGAPRGGTVYPSDVSVSTADGATGISTTGFSDTVTWPSGNAVDADTVTSSSFYVVPASGMAQVTRGEWNESNCNANNALKNVRIDTTVDNGDSSSTITILEELTAGKIYYVCLTNAIKFSNEATFAGMTNSFTTAGQPSFTLTSTDITDGGTIPQVNAHTGCGGSNHLPQMTWTNRPDGTQSYAITVIDEDSESFIHWILYNIPSTVTSLIQGAPTPAGATTVQNGFGAIGYGGPCPPTGETHTYEFTVYALDVTDATSIAGFDDSGNTGFVSAISNNTLGFATIRGNYTAQ